MNLENYLVKLKIEMYTNTPSSKTNIPLPPPPSLKRSRLLNLLTRSQQKKLVLISAPAGYGKTHLTSEWALTCKFPVIWLTLENNDNYSDHFLNSFISALQAKHILRDQINLNFCKEEIFKQDNNQSIEHVLRFLSEQISKVQPPLSFCIDNFHLIQDIQIHRAVQEFLTLLPVGINLTVITRFDPPWQLGRLRGNNQIAEIRSADLAFTEHEIKRYLNTIMKMCLSQTEIQNLSIKLEGWAAGLQMAIGGMKNAINREKFIRDFSGSNRDIFAYLLEEILNTFSEKEREFLKKTSIFDPLTPDLCRAVTGFSDCNTILEKLTTTNSFIFLIDDEKREFRYQNLFSDFLKTNFTKDKDELKELHLSGSKWYAANNYLLLAIEHAKASGYQEYLLSLLESILPILADRIGYTELISWLDNIEFEKIVSHPVVSLACARVYINSGHLEEAERLIGHPLLNRCHILSFQAKIEAYRAYIAFLRWDQEKSYLYALKAIRLNTSHNPEPEILLSLMILAVISHAQGKLLEAKDLFKQLLAVSRTGTYQYFTLNILGEYSDLLWTMGQLSEYEKACQEAIQLGENLSNNPSSLPVMGYIFVRYSNLLREKNKLNQALEFSQKSISILNNWGQKDYLILAFYINSKILFEMNEVDEAWESLKKAAENAISLSPEYQETCLFWQINFLLLNNMIVESKTLLNKSSFQPSTDTFSPIWKHIIWARYLLFSGQIKKAGSILNHLKLKCTRCSADAYLIEILLLLAAFFRIMEQQEMSTNCLRKALILGKTTGFKRVFINHKELFKKSEDFFREDELYQNFFLEILEMEPDSPHSDLIEQLTKREKEVLLLLDSNLSAAEIAERLFVEPSTINAHIKQIYQKLQVNRRYQAVKKAEKLNLL